MLKDCYIMIGMVAAASGCSNMLVSKGATTDGSTQIAYNSDGQVRGGTVYVQAILFAF